MQCKEHGKLGRKGLPSCERVCSLQIEFVPFFNKSLPIAPFMDAIMKIRVQDLLSCDAQRKKELENLNYYRYSPSVVKMHPSGCAEYASYSRYRKLATQ